MLDLSTISFKVDTSELDRAGKAIGELVTNVGKLDKSARDAAQTEVVLAKAAKLNADANLQNAKAQDVRLKSTITADKADQQAAAAIEKKTKATEKATESSAKNVGVLQRQKDILEFQTQGFSKGQSSILAYAKAAGLAAEDIGELGKVLETQRKLMGGDPFDKSLSGLKSLQNQYTELKESIRQYAADSNLTAKQTRELARDKERLIEKMKVEGASFSEIRQAVRAHNTEYVNLATSYNKMISAEDAVIKSRKEAVNATNYLTQADQKMAAALNTSNAALDKAGTDSLVKYESALRKSGVSQDVATQKLATYKAQLAQVAAVEEKRRAQHLARALTPQISDVAVSLWSGQSPLTVLLQQGAQINDMFQLSGVAAADFGKTVKEAFSSMLPSILTVVKGVGGLLVDGFVAAGNAVSSFLAKSVGMAGALDKLYMKMSENGPSKWGGVILGLSSLITGVFAVGIAVAVAGLVALGTGLKQVIEENNELAKAFALSGASMGVSHTQVIGYVKTLADSGATTGQATEALLAMAKAGNFTSNEILLVSDSAIQMQKGFGIAIEDTVKQFTKLKEKPVEALLEIAKSSGMVGPEVIKMVQELERAGKSTEAASVAMKAYADVTKQQVAQMKENYNGFALFMIDLGQKIKQFFSDTFKTLFLATDPNQQLEDQLGKLRERIKEVSGNLKTLGSFGDPKLLNQLKEQERMLISQIGANVRIRGEEEKRKYLNAENAKYESAIASLRGNALDSIEKETRKTQTLADFRRNFVEDKLKDAAREKAVDLEKLKQNKDLVSLLEKQADIEYKKTQKSGGSKSENYYATLMREATNNTIAANTAAQELTKSEQKLLEVRSDPRFEKLTATQKQDVISKYEAAIAAEKQTALTEKLAEAEEHRLKLLGKSEGIGKQYYSDMQKLEEFAKVAGWSRSEVEELTRAVFMATPAWKAYEKALEDVKSAARKFNEDSLASQAATLKENESLDYRLSLLGKTAEEQRALSIEYNRANKLREVDIKLAKQLREIEEKIAKAKKDGLPESDYQSLIDAQVQARKDAAEQEKVINREVGVQYAEDLQKEFDAIKNGISDSIVTALFEGGKAGSKKFRDLVVAQLRKPVTMVVNAVVNTVLGNVLGSLMGGSANAATGGGGLVGTVSNISSAYRAATGFNTGWLTDFGSTLPGSIASTGANLYSQGFETIGSSMMDFGNSIAEYADAINTAGDLLGYGASIFAAANGQWGRAIGSAVGTYFGGPIGSFIGSTIGGLVDDIFSGGAGTPHTGAGVIYREGQVRGGAELYGSGAFTMGHRDEYNPEVEKLITPLAIGLGTTFDGIAKTFGQTAGYEIATAFADDSSDDGAWGSLRISKDGKDLLDWKDTRNSRWAPREFADGEEGYKQYLAAIAKDTRQVILDMDLPGWADQVLNDIGDSPSLESLSKAIQELAQMKSMYDLMTSQMVNFAGITDEAFGKLIKEFGDIGTMTNQVAGYYQNYYSEFERFNKAQADVTKSFTDLGLTMPTSREEFRKLAESQDLNTEAGRKMYAQLMALAASFGVAIDATEQLANARTDIMYRIMEQEAALLDAQGRTAEADKKRRELLDKQRGVEYERLMKINPELARLTAELWALEDATKAAADLKQAWKDATSTAYDVLEKAIQAQINILNKQATASEATISKLKGIFDLLKSAISDLYGEVASTAAMQASQGYKVIRDAISTGNLPEQSTLSSAISAVRSGISGTDFVSQFEADKARLQFAADLNTLLGQTEEQLSTEELTLKAIKDQIAMLELTLANAKSQLDAINGVNSSVLSVADAIREFQNALIPPTTTNLKEPPRVPSGGGGFSSGPSGPNDSPSRPYDPIADIKDLYNQTLDPASLRLQMYMRGWTVEQMAEAAGVTVDFARGHLYKDVPAFANGGAYQGGLALVGEEGPELINFSQGGQVYTAGQTASMLSGGDVVSAIESLENRVTDLGYALQAIAINTGKSSRVLERVTPDGDSILISGSVTVA